MAKAKGKAKTSRPKDGPAREEIEEARADGELDPAAQRAVARVAGPLGLLAFVLTAAIALVAVFFQRDADWSPLWLLLAGWAAAAWAVARDLRRQAG